MKNKRHRMIREIVENQNIETQLQLTQELRKFGFDVTQATISRDIKELGLIKVVSSENTFRYSLPAAVVVNNGDRSRRKFRDNVLKVLGAENMVLLKTLGSVAGDDTIFVLTPNSQCAKELVKRLHEYVE